MLLRKYLCICGANEIVNVPEVGLEPTSLAAAGFESAAYTIPPLRRARTISSYVYCALGATRVLKFFYYG